MRKNAKIVQILFYLALIILGAIAGIVLGHYNNLPLVEEIDIIDVAALMATIFLAVYVPTVLNRQLQILRDRKNLLEDRISDYQSLLRRVNMLVQGDFILSETYGPTMKNLLDVAGHRLDTLASLIRNSGFEKSLIKDVRKIKEIDEEHKKLLWSEKEINPEKYTEQIRQQEEILYNKLDELTCLLIFKINNSK